MIFESEEQAMHTALTIAGSDPSGGAGIQADLKTMLANGVYGMSAITALTAQNTVAVTGVYPVTAEMLAAQLESVLSDIPPDAVKIGMIPSGTLVSVIARKLRQHPTGPIVIDPVMVSSTEHELMGEDARTAAGRELWPMAALLTPNLGEASVLTGHPVDSRAEMERAARIIGERYGCAVLCKGGHLTGGADDYLWQPSGGRWIEGERIDNPNTHGTGCTLSSAIAANLAKGYPLEEAVVQAKGYLAGALGAMLDLGAGSGPLDHGYRWGPPKA